eukprot:2498322-Pyramimonas_sp.AAC.1
MYAQRGSPRDLAVPWGAAICAIVATFVAAICATVSTFVGSWDAQRRYAQRGSPRDLAAPWG